MLKNFHLNRALCCFAKPFEALAQSFLASGDFSLDCPTVAGGLRFLFSLSCPAVADGFRVILIFAEPAVAGLLPILLAVHRAAVADAFSILIRFDRAAVVGDFELWMDSTEPRRCGCVPSLDWVSRPPLRRSVDSLCCGRCLSTASEEEEHCCPRRCGSA